MAAPGTRSLRRANIVAVVLGLHAVLVSLLVLCVRSRPTTSSAAQAVSVLILLHDDLAAPASGKAPARRLPLPAGPPAAPSTAITMPMPREAPAPGAGSPVDWDAEARRAAAGVTARPQYRNFSAPQAPEWMARGHDSPRHEAGEQYRLATGELVIYVSDHCYLIDEPRPLGAPDVFARMAPMRVACQ